MAGSTVQRDNEFLLDMTDRALTTPSRDPLRPDHQHTPMTDLRGKQPVAAGRLLGACVDGRRSLKFQAVTPKSVWVEGFVG